MSNKINYSDYLRKLREIYVNATPRQRISVAQDRIKYPACSPNQLVQIVAAAESLARTITIYQRAKTKKDLKKEYTKVKLIGPAKLIKDYICPKIGKTPTKLLGRSTWQKFKFAVKYRNLLIHECTFLDRRISTEMIKAAENTFEKLKTLVK